MTLLTCGRVRSALIQPPFPITSVIDATVAGVRGFEHELLTYGRDAAQIFTAADADPSCALAAAYVGLAHVLRSTREGLALARPLIARAELHAPDATARERLLVAAVARWAGEDVMGARRLLSELLVGHPEDLFAAKLLQLLQFGRGDTAGMLRTAETVLPHHRATPQAHGMRAFALDQCGRRDEAEAAARRALALGCDPWAHHALAHVMDEAGRFSEGATWMGANAGEWAHCSSFLYTHNWWHAALFHLALGDPEGALRLHDDYVWAVRKDYCQDQINAISLLARLELAGVDVGDRWEDVAAYVAPRRVDGVDGFLDLHYAYALARAGDDASVADLLRTATDADAPGAPRWRRLMPAAIGGLVAFAHGRHDQAVALLAPITPSLQALGGSTVQRDLFRRVLDAARAGGDGIAGLAA